MRRALLPVLGLLGIVAIACVNVPPDPLQLDRGMLTVDNRTRDDWKDVEIWINQYFRVTVPTIAAGSRFQVPLNAFVSGYAQRFDAARLGIKDLRLTAKQPDGKPVTLKKDFGQGPGALGGKQ